MKNLQDLQKVFSRSMVSFLERHANIAEIKALAIVVRTSNRLYFLQETKIFEDVNPQELGRVIAGEIWPYTLNDDPVYFGQSLVRYPAKMLKKHLKSTSNLVTAPLANTLANFGIKSLIDLSWVNRPDLKGCGLSKDECGIVAKYLSDAKVPLGSLRSPETVLIPNPNGNIPDAIDVAINYITT